jgi:hypothetical protein
MAFGAGNTKVAHMSVSTAGASRFPAAQPALVGQPAERPSGKSNAAGAGNGDAGANLLPAAQAATTPGTGQKVNIIA